MEVTDARVAFRAERHRRREFPRAALTEDTRGKKLAAGEAAVAPSASSGFPHGWGFAHYVGRAMRPIANYTRRAALNISPFFYLVRAKWQKRIGQWESSSSWRAGDRLNFTIAAYMDIKKFAMRAAINLSCDSAL